MPLLQRVAWINDHLTDNVRWMPEFTYLCYAIMKSIANGATQDMKHAFVLAQATANTVPPGYRHMLTIAHIMELACEISGSMYEAYAKTHKANAPADGHNALGLDVGHTVSGASPRPQPRVTHGYAPYTLQRPVSRQLPVDKTVEVKKSVDELARMLGSVTLEDSSPAADIDIASLCAAFQRARLDAVAPSPATSQPAAAPRLGTVALPDIEPVPPFVHPTPIVQPPAAQQPSLPSVTAAVASNIAAHLPAHLPAVEDAQAGSCGASRRPTRASKPPSRCRSDPLCRAGRLVRCVA
ncbi:hypothetical protein AURDEDRAFT_142978 [Auricularia subglabra TFB-10046 SS5]|nr:hypothetical protein AURDEDRAFT_142978 [Auricularia subglabra TFB-10046 SS5]